MLRLYVLEGAAKPSPYRLKFWQTKNLVNLANLKNHPNFNRQNQLDLNMGVRCLGSNF